MIVYLLRQKVAMEDNLRWTIQRNKRENFFCTQLCRLNLEISADENLLLYTVLRKFQHDAKKFLMFVVVSAREYVGWKLVDLLLKPPVRACQASGQFTVSTSALCFCSSPLASTEMQNKIDIIYHNTFGAVHLYITCNRYGYKRTQGIARNQSTFHHDRSSAVKSNVSDLQPARGK